MSGTAWVPRSPRGRLPPPSSPATEPRPRCRCLGGRNWVWGGGLYFYFEKTENRTEEATKKQENEVKHRERWLAAEGQPRRYLLW